MHDMRRKSDLRTVGWFTGVLGSLVSAVPGAAQPTPVGDDFQINAYTTDVQGRPDVAALGDEFLVVWDSLGSSGDDSIQRSIQGRRFDGSGAPLASEFQVNEGTGFSEFEPRVDGLSDGRFVVQWRTLFQSTYELVSSLAARGFDAADQPTTGDFVSSVSINGYESHLDHAIAMGTTGEFVAVYSQLYNDYQFTFDSQIEARRFDAMGTFLDSDDVANSFDRTFNSNVDRAPDGTFTVVWNDISYVDFSTEVGGRKLDAGGEPMATFQVVDGFANNEGFGVDVAHGPAGDFVVVWSAVDPYYGIDHEILFRRFDASGQSLGPATQLNSYTTSGQVLPRVAPVDGSRFLVVWQSSGSPDSDTDAASIRGRLIGANGAPEGVELQVNTTTTGDQQAPEIASSDDGRTVLVVWQSDSSTGSDTDESSIQGRRLTISGIFADGFESGDLSRWSSSQP